MEQPLEGASPGKPIPPPRPPLPRSGNDLPTKGTDTPIARPVPPPPPIRGLPKPAAALTPLPTAALNTPPLAPPMTAKVPVRTSGEEKSLPAAKKAVAVKSSAAAAKTSPAQPAPAPSDKATAPLPTSDIAVRTMQDDMRDIQRGVILPKPPSATRVSSPPPAATSTTKTAAIEPSKPASAFPLPPKDARGKQKVVLAPKVARRRGRHWLLWLFFFVVLLGGGAAGAWYWYTNQQVAEAPTAAALQEAATVLPSEHLLILQYHVPAGETRTETAQAWRNDEVTPTVAMLLDGDPRLLLADTDATEFFYVLLEGASRPYVVVPQTPYTTQLFAEGGASVVERNGWFIAHALSVTPYETALEAGTLTEPAPLSLFAAGSSPDPLRMAVSTAALSQLRRTLAGEPFAVGGLQALQLTGRYDPVQHNLVWQGTADTAVPPQAGQLSAALLQLLPAQFSTARVGANFHQDVQQWLTAAPNGAGDALGQPAVRQFIEQLETPYFIFLNTLAGSIDSMGVVIEIPPELQSHLTLDEPAVPQAMPVLLSLILDQRTVAPVTFSEGEYAGIPLRYANIVDTSKALDYAITDTHIVIATSKDAMFSLLDAVAGTAASASATQPWARLLTAQTSAVATDNLLITTLPTGSSLSQLLPTSGAPAAMSLQLVPEVTGIKAHATIALP